MPEHAKASPSTGLPPRYDAAAVQQAVARAWEEERAFHAEPTDPGEPFCIVIPPPNVTGALHLGHALNNTIQDILVRRARMEGKNAVWIPGTDHAGISTQAVVDKRLQAEGKPSLKDYKKLEAEGKNGREQFVKLVQAWKDEYEQRILGQLKAMGCSCDFDRTAFTMDEARAHGVREAFFRLFKDGLIYRGKRLVNWDPATQTALSDDEVEDEEVDGHFYYLRYPLEPSGCSSGDLAAASGAPQEKRQRPVAAATSADHITVATTRPETMLGDTAVAINPNDPRAKELRGRFVRLPITGRRIPLIEDEYVVMADPESEDPKARYATGFLKVTPAHDPNDWEIGQRHGLQVINIFAPDASISKDYGWSDFPESVGGPASSRAATAASPRDAGADGVDGADTELLNALLGKSREEARKLVVQWFKDHGLLEDVKPYRHSVGHSYRSHVPIEPYLSDQWYVAVRKPIPWLADEGLVEGTEVPKSSLAGLALRALCSSGDLAAAPVAGTSEGQRPVAAATSGGERALTFVPERYAKTFRLWHENIRDWCISRQLWWGHRIPVWRQEGVSHSKLMPEGVEHGAPGWTFALVRDGVAYQHVSGPIPPHAGHGFSPVTTYACPSTAERDQLRQSRGTTEWTQDPDVLDTWFSSALWPMSTLGWPDESAISDLKSPLNVWNPTDVLCTAREIITLWVSRMVMFNRYMRAHPDEKRTSNVERPTSNVEAGGPASPRAVGATGVTGSGSAPSEFNVGRSKFDVRSSPAEPGPVPFRTVFIHAMIQDGEGRKMSKSLGNGVDPLDIIDSHGADAMRFTLAQMTTLTQDVRVPVVRDEATGKNTSPKFDLGRNFCNKLWNAARFVIGSIAGAMSDEATKRTDEGAESNPIRSSTRLAPTDREDAGPPTSTLDVARSTFDVPSERSASDPSSLRRSVASSLSGINEHSWSIIDRWILSRLARTVQAANDAIDEFRFDRYATACYDFFWRDFCDWYVEASKPAMKAAGEQAIQTAHILATCLDVSLRLMHPMIPFATERLWWALCEVMPERGIPGRIMGCANPRIIRAAWPRFDEQMDTLTSTGAERVVERLQEIVQAIRTVRTDNKVEPRKTVPVVIRHPANVAHHLAANKATVELWAGCEIVEMGESAAEPSGAAKTTAAGCEIFVLGLADPAAEAQRLARQRADLEKKIKTLRGRLENKGYTEKAPANLVQQTRDELAAAEAELAALK